MKKSKNEHDPRKYSNYQFAFRVKDKAVLEALQSELEALYDRFNKGRDPHEPKGIRAVKINDIALKAIRIGLRELKTMKSWKWDE
ncbi:MAG: hypothetical protein A4S09_06250 [Proteobacteria bacterium SG_bin7]|nr:MAG: hypothetical protein A4S09_06250 [Proteobacteria bacterium SG_bin7]